MLKKISVGFGAFALALLGLAQSAHAATDAALTAAFASSTAMITDNYQAIALFVVGIGVLVVIIRLAKRGVIMASKWIVSAFAGAGRKKR